MTWIVVLLLAPFAVLTVFFIVELVAGLMQIPSRPAAWPKSAATVIIPAHDEASIIERTVKTLATELPEGVRMLVVADNCSDATADIARCAGAEVIERNDKNRRGKGYALAFAADHLACGPSTVFAVLDADCTMDRASLKALISVADTGSPAQAVYLFKPDKAAPPRVQISNFAFMLKNLVRQRGLQLLAGRVHLAGTGMAMPSELFRASDHVRSSIVEDLAQGLELSCAGHPPVFVPEAIVWSSAATQEETLNQRRRWEGGFLATSLKRAPRLLWNSVWSGDLKAALAGLDLMVPPLALFAVLNAGVLSAAIVFAELLGADWWPVIVHFGLLAVALLTIFAVWVREGQQFISIGVLVRLPLYVLWKIPMYLGLMQRGVPSEWRRTER